MGETVGLLLRENAIARLREVMETRELGAAWKSLLGEIQHQGTVYGVTSAAIPHLVDLAPHLPAESRLELWTEIGFLVTAGADRFPAPPAEGLQEGLTAALGTAEVLALRDFLAGTDSSPDDDSYFALTCVALAGHPVGRAIWKFPSQSSGYMQMDCPGCGAEAEVDGFALPRLPAVSSTADTAVRASTAASCSPWRGSRRTSPAGTPAPWSAGPARMA